MLQNLAGTAWRWNDEDACTDSVDLVISSSEERRGEIYGRSRRTQRGALQKGGNRTNKMYQSIAANKAEESGRVRGATGTSDRQGHA